jgi:glycyl-tRNA synthetase
LFETAIGSVSETKSKVYLRGETAQGIFTNFKQVLDSTRIQLPFGIGQIGKSFRNEITTGQFIFRTLEFEQAEIEYFFNPDETKWETLMDSWKDAMHTFVTKGLGIKSEHVRWRRHTDKERSHYSKDTYDLDYEFPFGWKELWGVAYRTDYDLKQHMEHSRQSLEYVDPQTGKKFVPHVIEPAVGINRLALMVLADAYHEDKAEGRIVLKLAPQLAPYVACVSPLLANKEQLVTKAKGIFDMLLKHTRVTWDARGNIGKRYAAQDEIGTPFCITIDFQTLEDDTVTIRDRDTAKQERIAVSQLQSYILDRIQ